MKIIIVVEGGLIQNICADDNYADLRVLIKDYDIDGREKEDDIFPDRNGSLVAISEPGVENWPKTAEDFEHFDALRQACNKSCHACLRRTYCGWYLQGDIGEGRFCFNRE